MACDCLKKSEEKTLEHLKGTKTDREIEHGSYNNTTFLYDATPPRTQLYNEFEYYYKPIKKDGSLGAQRREKISILPAFCGFCGEKYDE